jgi:type II secretion system protein J
MYSNKGFTLLEMLIASMIGAFVILVGVGALRAVSSGSRVVENNFDAAAELRYAKSRIAADLVNIYRDKNYDYTKLLGTLQEVDGSLIPIITFYTVSRIKARTGQPEGDVYEVEYFLKKDEQNSVLMRRQWPNPDPNSVPGGILSVIAEDIDLFAVRYFDGTDWLAEWTQDMGRLPVLVEVSLAAKIKGTNELVGDAFIAKLPVIEADQTATIQQTSTGPGGSFSQGSGQQGTTQTQGGGGQ